MTITEHKALVAAIPEDLKEGEEIEVSELDGAWIKAIFRGYRFGWIDAEIPPLRGISNFSYARRPAAAQKKSLEQALAENGWGQRPYREDMERGPE